MGERFSELLHAVRVRLRPLFTRERQQRELDDEVRFHLEREAEKLRGRGMDARRAAREARLAFGGEDRFKEEVRTVTGVARVEAVLGDLRYAMRLLRRRPVHTLLLVGSLAVGLGASGGIWRAAEPLLLGGLPFATPAELVVLQQRSPDGRVLPLSLPDLGAWTDADPTLDRVAGFDPTATTLGDAEGVRHRVEGAEVTREFFAVLGVPPQSGRSFTAAEDRPGGEATVVLSHGLWLERFGGDAGMLGRTVELGAGAHTVVGIMPRGFSFPGGSRFWVSAGRIESYEDSLNFDLVGIARLGSGASSGAGRDLAAIGDRLRTEAPGRDPALEPLVSPLRSRIIPPETGTAAVLLLIGVLLLLGIGASTGTHLLLARLGARAGELRTRLRLGATHGRVFRQLAAEGGTIALLSGTLALPIAWAFHEALAGLIRDQVPGLVQLSPSTLATPIAVVAGLLVALSVGGIPALAWGLRQSRKSPSVDRGPGRRARSAFVGVQAGVAVLLTSGALGTSLVFMALVDTDPGFRHEGVVTALVSFPEDVFGEREARRTFVRTLTERLEATAGVERVAATLRTPVVGSRIELAVESGDVSSDPAVAVFNGATPGFFDVLGIPLLEGRGFAPGDGTAEAVVVVSERLARTLWPGQVALGRTLRLGDDRNEIDPSAPLHRVVGVVGDIRHEGHVGPADPAVWVPYDQFPAYYATFLVDIGRNGEARTIADIRAALRSSSPDMVVQRVEPLGTLLENSVSRPRLLARVMVFLALTALVLTAAGAYAVVAWWVEERRRETGVRRALGASGLSVVARTVGVVIRAATVGALVGAAAAWPGQRALTAAVGTAGPGWGATVAAVGLVLVAALGAALGPAIRAARASPVEAIRGEASA